VCPGGTLCPSLSQLCGNSPGPLWRGLLEQQLVCYEYFLLSFQIISENVLSYCYGWHGIATIFAIDIVMVISVIPHVKMC
jgi:hypothetical protein